MNNFVITYCLSALYILLVGFSRLSVTNASNTKDCKRFLSPVSKKKFSL